MEIVYPIAKEFKFQYQRYFGKPARNEYSHLLDQWKRIIDTEAPPSVSLDSPSVLFITGYGLGSHYYLIEPLLMQALRQRGARVSSVICASSLPACEFNTNGNNKPKIRYHQRSGLINSTIVNKCILCSNNVSTILAALDINTLKISDYLPKSAITKAQKIIDKIDLHDFREFELDNIKIGEEAFASILRATFKGEIGDSNRDNELKRRFLMSGILNTWAYISAFRSIKPDKIVCIHGIYQIHGLAVKVAKKLNIPVDVIGGGGIRKNTLIACHGETYHHQLINEDNRVWNTVQLDEDQISKVLEYAKNKRNSGAGVDYLSYHPNPIEDEAILRSHLGLSENTLVIAMYTNVIWDAQVVYSSNVFNDIFDWIWTSITEVKKNKKVTLVIRIHPAETKGGVPTKQPMLNEIYKKFPKLPENVKIIPPSSDLSSYTLANIADLNIIYGTKMGLEIALMKSPLLIAGETFSRNKGYGHDVKSRKEYIEILSDIKTFLSTIDLEKCYSLALKYAHYYYFRRMLDLPIEDDPMGLSKQGKLCISKSSDLGPKNYRSLDVICDGILNDTNFYLP